MPQNQASFTIEDYDGEKSTMSLNLGPITAANFTALRAALDTLKAATQAMIDGRLRKTSITEQFAEDAAAVSVTSAQRESKFLVTYRDVTQFLDVANTINNVGFGNLYSVEIPAAKLSLLSGNTDLLNLADSTVSDFVEAFEAVQNSPTGGNEIQVVSIRHVGRNS